MPEPLSDERLVEIHDALAGIPAAPWRWIGHRHTGPMLVTAHSGQLHLLGVEHPREADGSQVERADGTPAYADLLFRHRAPGARYAQMRPAAELAIGRTDYDPDTIRGIDNPVARWVENSALYAAELLAEVYRLRGIIRDACADLTDPTLTPIIAAEHAVSHLRHCTSVWEQHSEAVAS